MAPAAMKKFARATVFPAETFDAYRASRQDFLLSRSFSEKKTCYTGAPSASVPSAPVMRTRTSAPSGYASAAPAMRTRT